MAILEKEITIFNEKEKDRIFNDCFNNTYDTTLKTLKNGDYFVITGDIPAMWLRDSSAQVLHYLHFGDDPKIKALIKGVLNKQFEQILIDPYANAFMENENQTSQWAQYMKTDFLPKIVWERKFELDSLCYPLFLLIKYIRKTNDSSVLNQTFLKAFERILEIVEIERNHSSRSTYFYYLEVPWRKNAETCGKNTNPNEEKGLVWSGFRPSDDLCEYNYHIPDNMFLVSVLNSLGQIFNFYLKDNERSNKCFKLVNELKVLIEKYGVVEDDEYGKIYCSETNCLGQWHANDDANVPSLLSIPYLEYPFIDKEIYENTRKFILSNKNKFYFEGKILKGIGSPHTPKNMVWPISLCMQGITSNDIVEKQYCLDMLFETAKVDGLMHESVDVNNVNNFTRPWFAWANSLFSDFVLDFKNNCPKK